MVELLSVDRLPQDLLSHMLEAQRLIDAGNAEISRLVLEHAGLAAGDVVEDPLSGLRYRVRSIRGWRSGANTGLTILGRRLYKSGRRMGLEARSDSHISSRCVKVNG